MNAHQNHSGEFFFFLSPVQHLFSSLSPLPWPCQAPDVSVLGWGEDTSFLKLPRIMIVITFPVPFLTTSPEQILNFMSYHLITVFTCDSVSPWNALSSLVILSS